MKVIYNEDNSLKFEVLDEAVNVYYNGEVYEIYKDGENLELRKRALVSFADFLEKKEKVPPYANSWDYHTYVKSEDCDG
jgi:hypothetical protein|tara:strand:+ start:2401 stop:2637 length:237 start_codon:yes stop_codon:yes gene_type:complete